MLRPVNYLASIDWVKYLGNSAVNDWFSADRHRLTLEKRLAHSMYKVERSFM